jgi:hypothetical protein
MQTSTKRDREIPSVIDVNSKIREARETGDVPEFWRDVFEALRAVRGSWATSHAQWNAGAPIVSALVGQPTDIYLLMTAN